MSYKSLKYTIFTSTFLFAGVVLFLTIATVKGGVVLFEDGFDSGDFTVWDEAGTDWHLVNNAVGAHSPNYRAEGRGSDTTGSILVKYQSTEGYGNITLSFWYQIPDSGFEIDEDMDVDYTLDGGVNWSNLVRFEDGDEVDVWTNWQGNLPAGAEDNPDFGIRFQTNAGVASDIFKLDDVIIMGDSLDTDGDGVASSDMCPDTATDNAANEGENLKPNRWIWNGETWMQGVPPNGIANDKTFSMEDTHGCGCDQILDTLERETGQSYEGHRKHGCSQSILEGWSLRGE